MIETSGQTVIAAGCRASNRRRTSGSRKAVTVVGVMPGRLAASSATLRGCRSASSKVTACRFSRRANSGRSDSSTPPRSSATTDRPGCKR